MSTPTNDEKIEDALFCHKDGNRVCNAQCVAFLVARPPGPEYEGAPWAMCQELVSQHRSAKHLVLLTQMAAEHFKLEKTRLQDSKRAGSLVTG